MAKLVIGLNPYYNGKYSMSKSTLSVSKEDIDVLILIIMENTLWVFKIRNYSLGKNEVLILIIMENTLWATFFFSPSNHYSVLILIIMENTLWVGTNAQYRMNI